MGWQQISMMRRSVSRASFGVREFAEVTTVEMYPFEKGTLPCLFNDPGSGTFVEGELYRLPKPESFDRLDQFEGHPHLYKRGLIRVRDGAGNEVVVWTYFYQGARRGLKRR